MTPRSWTQPKKSLSNTASFSLGVSFSLKYCTDLGLDWREVMTALIDEVGVRRFRLMSYWSLIEAQQGRYKWAELDDQMERSEASGVAVSLCLGLRQPRYPESHQPEWAKELWRSDRTEWQSNLNNFITAVVLRYRDHPALVSWQLENEALNRSFGEGEDFDRKRLRAELRLVKNLDPNHPVIMSTSDTFGLPIRRPRPDIVGFSLYRIGYDKGAYQASKYPLWWYRWRAAVIKALIHRPSIIHELQAEPWGPGGNQDMSAAEQDKSMNPVQLLRNVAFARATGLGYADLWGAEWWYWRKITFHDNDLWSTATQIFKNPAE